MLRFLGSTNDMCHAQPGGNHCACGVLLQGQSRRWRTLQRRCCKTMPSSLLTWLSQCRFLDLREALGSNKHHSALYGMLEQHAATYLTSSSGPSKPSQCIIDQALRRQGMEPTTLSRNPQKQHALHCAMPPQELRMHAAVEAVHPDYVAINGGAVAISHSSYERCAGFDAAFQSPQVTVNTAAHVVPTFATRLAKHCMLLPAGNQAKQTARTANSIASARMLIY
jgi:hypothetical protein